MNKGFRYTVEREKIKEYMRLSATEKLQWLAELQLLTEKTLTKKEKKIRRILLGKEPRP